jgi:hypothetical protein
MPIPDEKARAWTRPEDYWPPRRPRRSAASANKRLGPASRPEAPDKRPLLDIVPYAALMLGLAIMAMAIIVLAWPGRYAGQPSARAAPVSEVGTAPKGWIDGR